MASALARVSDLEDAVATTRESLARVERQALALIRSGGAVRAGLCHAARALCDGSRIERLGYVTHADYARERLGISGREFRDLARVGRALARSALLVRISGIVNAWIGDRERMRGRTISLAWRSSFWSPLLA